MINDEKYINFLKQIISCISHGDYYSVKELSQLELERMEKEMRKNIIWKKSKITQKYPQTLDIRKKNMLL